MVDASAWVAFFNRRDAHYAEARHILTQLLHSPTPMATSTWVTYEAVTIVRSKLGYGRARRLWQFAMDRRLVTMINVDRTTEAAALQLFWRYRDKEWGVVDCTSLVLMEQIGCDAAFAFDRHFVQASRQRGFRVL